MRAIIGKRATLATGRRPASAEITRRAGDNSGSVAMRANDRLIHSKRKVAIRLTDPAPVMGDLEPRCAAGFGAVGGHD
jgi:hypothetical protein